MEKNIFTIDVSIDTSFKKSFKLKDGYDNIISIGSATKEQIELSASGKNVIITVYEDADKTTKLGTITLTNGDSVNRHNGSTICLRTKKDDKTYNLLYNTGTDLICNPEIKGNSINGSWSSEIVYSSNKNENINLGGGFDNIYWDYSKKAQGKDTVILNRKEELNLNFLNTEGLNFIHSKSGNDAVVTVLKLIDTTVDNYKITYKVSNVGQWNKKISYTAYTLQPDGNYSKTGKTYSATVLNIVYYEAIDYLKEAGIDFSNKSGTFYIGVTKGFDIGLVAKDLNNDNIDDIKNMKNELKYTSFTDPYNYGQVILKNYFTLGTQLVTKEGYAELPITSTSDGAEILTQKAILATLNASYDRRGKTNNQTISDTFLNETIYGGSGDDTIKSLGGDDKITGGAGNDKITAKNGTKTLYFNTGDKKDTITTDKYTSLILKLDEGNKIPGIFFSKKGNNLIINRLSSTKINGNPVPNLNDSITIQNYFSIKPNITIDYTQINDDVPSIVELNPNTIQLTQFGSDTKNNTISGTALNDVIYAGKKTTKINAGDGNNTIWQSTDGSNIAVNSGKNNDIYYIRDFNKTVTITDKNGNDEIICSGVSGSDIHYLFDITKAGKINSAELNIIGSDKALANIVSDAKLNNKGKLPISVKINNFFKKNSEGETGTGYIENIDLNDREYNFEEVREAVASWLTDNGYSSVNQFISKGAGDNELTQQLFEIFDNGFKNNIQ